MQESGKGKNKELANTTSKKKTTIQKKGRSVKAWIQGIQAGTLEAKINHYYDNVKSFDEYDPKIHKDPARMSRIQQLQHYNYLTTQIKQHAQTRQDATTKTDGNPEPKTTK